jgi:hypothetical protein
MQIMATKHHRPEIAAEANKVVASTCMKSRGILNAGRRRRLGAPDLPFECEGKAPSADVKPAVVSYATSH